MKPQLDYTESQVCSMIDWERVTEAIRTVTLPQWDQQAVGEGVVSLVSRFGPSDLTFIKLEGIEHSSIIEVPENAPAVPYFGATEPPPNSDPSHCMRLIVDGYGAFEDSRQGYRMGWDWKTAGTLDAAWADRVRNSWQGRIYCAGYAMEAFEYRGIDRHGRIRVERIEWPLKKAGRIVYGDGDVYQYIRQAMGLRETFRHHDVWTKRMPFACKAFGRECQHKATCDGNTNKPQVINLRPASYSGLETFLLCPERYRLDSLEGAEREDSEPASYGRALHLGIAEAYRQLMDKQKEQCNQPSQCQPCSL